MVLLIVVSLIWAFSFGLIKRFLVGVDSTFVATARLGLALLVFLPFLRLRGMPWKTALSLAAIFVTLLADALDRKLRPRALLAALLSVVGTGFVALKSLDLNVTLIGLALVQFSNAAFAIGQVFYRRLRARHVELRDRDVFALLYGSAFIVAALAMFAKDVSVTLTPPQLVTLLYLGILASGVGFFLWNVGATRVSAGTLAVMNNAKVPLAVAVSLIFFDEQAHLLSLIASLILMASAVALADSNKQPLPESTRSRS
jgi:drug/metabolite transporter (DMT)-like permease